MSALPGEAARRNSSGWYLYGVIAAESAPVRLGAAAVDPTEQVVFPAEGPLAGVASRVPLAEFDQESLPARLRDAAWFEEKIRAHEQVLEDVLAATAVVPCRFCTVYRDEDELRRFLAEHRETLADVLERVAGRVELGVKAFVDRERFAAGGGHENPAIAELSERVSGAEGGRAYLERRRLEQLVAEELARFEGEAAADIHARLLAAAEDGRALPLQEPELAGRSEPMLFNGAYLVADRAAFERELAALAGDLRERGVELELTGPWPPYNFVPTELGAA